MSYGASTPTTRLSVSFTCNGCQLVATLHVDVGKDYIFEDTMREAQRLILTACGWSESRGLAGPGHRLLWCHDCRRLSALLPG